MLTRTFPKVDGAISLSSAQVMYLNDLSASVQLQLNQLRDGSATANNAVNARYANSASLALYANSASFAALAATANSASYAALAGTATLALTANSASYAALAGAATTATTATNATNATNATVATFASTCTSASSAALLSGLGPSDANVGNTVAQRDSAGDLTMRLPRIEYTGQGWNGVALLGINAVGGSGTDNYARPTPIATVGQNISGQNITGRTGTAKTLSSSSPSGGSNGDIWYQYV